ncbi:RDD family protein [Paenibacillus macerans]|uniref:RDD family protein n=2 Tax=Paenibacillus macerans TaxID=44252 RepID=A0A6N8EPG6_PAEMA|nr:RDD family protein [Paenibacillus macerans]
MGRGSLRMGQIYAGFWKRFCAYILDLFVVNIIVLVITLIFSLIDKLFLRFLMSFISLGIKQWFYFFEFYEWIGWITRLLLTAFGAWLYYAIMESSKWQGTFGKMALGIVVVNRRYERMSFLRASGRFWGRFLSVLSLYIGFIMAGFTEKKQALHDKIAQTYVVNKSASVDEERL